MISEGNVMIAQEKGKAVLVLVYAKPELVLFGSVAGLTAGCSGSGADGGTEGNNDDFGPGGVCGPK